MSVQDDCGNSRYDAAVRSAAGAPDPVAAGFLRCRAGGERSVRSCLVGCTSYPGMSWRPRTAGDGVGVGARRRHPRADAGGDHRAVGAGAADHRDRHKVAWPLTVLWILSPTGREPSAAAAAVAPLISGALPEAVCDVNTAKGGGVGIHGIYDYGRRGKLSLYQATARPALTAPPWVNCQRSMRKPGSSGTGIRGARSLFPVTTAADDRAATLSRLAIFGVGRSQCLAQAQRQCRPWGRRCRAPRHVNQRPERRRPGDGGAPDGWS